MARKSGQPIVFDYEPREAFIPFHQRKERFSCMVVHRRGGKTVACINDLILRALHTKEKRARYAYVAPYYRQAKDVAWGYLKEGVKDFAIKIRESDLRVELPNGAWITLYGSDNPDAMRGLYFMGVVLDEYGDCRPSLWSQVIIPTLLDYKGWAVFIGTPKGKNHFYQIYQRSLNEKGWYNLTLKSSESGIIDKSELLEMKAQMSDEIFEQEMECSFTAAIMGTFYASLIQKLELGGSIGPKACRYDSSLDTNCAADIGRTDSTAMWFWQNTPQGVKVIDYEEHQGKVVDFYIEMLRAKPYRYESLWLPMDAKAKTLATKRSTVEQFLDAGFPCRLVPSLAVQHGIDAARLVLKNVTIDSEACYSGVEALRAYRREYSELTKSFSTTPKHDWASDGADGFRYLALVCKESINFTLKETIEVDAEATYNFSLEDLHGQRALSKPKTILRI